jgi:hypothetical protein
MTLSLVVAAPASDWPAFQAIALSLGYTAGDGVACMKDGVEWRAIHDASTPERAAIMMGDVPPPDSEDYTSAQASAAIAQCIVSCNGLTAAQRDALGEDESAPVLKGRTHFDKVLAENGMTVIAADLP